MNNSLRNCRICGNVYMHINGPQLCQNCRDVLDNIYFRARDEIRDASAGEKFDSLKLAEKLNVDPLYIQILVEEGLFDKEEIGIENASSRKNLADQFAQELMKMQGKNLSEKTSPGKMFIDERRGRKRI